MPSIVDGSSPIGIFDSGIGGLTVVREILLNLAGESLIYLGDTARVPYGTKSSRTVVRYSLSNAGFLVPKGIKLLVAACNTASAFAIPALRNECGLPVVGVIEPGAKKAASATKTGRVGVIGTSSTIKSGAYKKAVHEIDPEITVYSTPCPLFVPLADEGLNNNDIARLAAQRYLAPLKGSGVDVLILGCTHYPLLKSIIQEAIGEKVLLVDSAQETAAEIKGVLEKNDLANNGSAKPTTEFYLTDVSDTFVEVAERFLGREIEHIEQVDIGNNYG
ncbi:MAG: glutamate racemase [Thermodesulfobacteriota bacterium]